MPRGSLTADRLMAIAWIVVGVAMLVASTGIPHSTISDPLGADLLPRVLAGSLVVFGIWLLLPYRTRAVTDAALEAQEAEEEEDTGAPEPGGTLRVGVTAALIAGLLLAMPYVGFIVSTAAAAAGVMLIGKIRDPRALILYPLGLSASLYGIFNGLLGVQFP